jgi:hypothetical protein
MSKLYDTILIVLNIEDVWRHTKYNDYFTKIDEKKLMV